MIIMEITLFKHLTTKMNGIKLCDVLEEILGSNGMKMHAKDNVVAVTSSQT